MNVCENFWIIDDGFFVNHVRFSDKFAGFPLLHGFIWKIFMLVCVLVKRVYGLRTWGLWVLCISWNWFEWVYLINLLNLLIVWFYLKFLNVNWCFGLESIYGFRTWGFWVLSISRNWVERVYLITLLNLPIVWFYLKLFHVNWCFGLEGIWFQDLGFAGFEYKQQLVWMGFDSWTFLWECVWIDTFGKGSNPATHFC